MRSALTRIPSQRRLVPSSGRLLRFHPPGEIQDASLLSSEAARLRLIADGRAAPSFPYPDMLRWRSPKSPLDLVGAVDDSYAIAGLGGFTPVGQSWTENGRVPTVLEWTRTWFGQTLLVKRRTRPQRLPPHLLPVKETWVGPPELIRARNTRPSEQLTLEPGESGAAARQRAADRSTASPSRPSDVTGSAEQLVQRAVRSGFNATVIGDHVKALINRQGGSEPAVHEYISMLEQALAASSRRVSRRDQPVGAAHHPDEDSHTGKSRKQDDPDGRQANQS
jgi:hypothetical protein